MCHVSEEQSYSEQWAMLWVLKIKGKKWDFSQKGCRAM